MQRDAPEAVSFTQQYGSEHGFADTYCVFQHGLEYWFQLARRAGDDAQHLRRRRLLIERLTQFVEQPRVLNRDYGLSGEVLDEINLLVSKREHLGAIDYNGAHQLVLFQHRDRKLDACPSVHHYSRRVEARRRIEIVLYSLNVVNVGRLPR